MDYAQLTAKTCDIARAAGAYLRSEISALGREEIQVKSLNNFVTRIDQASEAFLVSKLSDLIPDSGFIVEENTVGYQKKDFIWIIDPLDGTTNYIHGVPLYCVSIGLMHNDRLVAGVVYEVGQDECFYAWDRGGAWLNGKPIQVSKEHTLKNSLLATGFPYHDYNRLDQYMQIFTYCLKNTHGLRRLGSAAADLAYVACGRYDGFFEYGLSPWDVAAGCLIVKEAGGNNADFKGGNDYLFGKEVIAANPLIMTELTEVIQSIFKT